MARSERRLHPRRELHLRDPAPGWVDGPDPQRTADTTNGTKVQTGRFVGTNKVAIADSGAGNGSYKISFWDHPEKCLDSGSQTANGTRVQMYDCAANNKWQQQWIDQRRR